MKPLIGRVSVGHPSSVPLVNRSALYCLDNCLPLNYNPDDDKLVEVHAKRSAAK